VYASKKAPCMETKKNQILFAIHILSIKIVIFEKLLLYTIGIGVGRSCRMNSPHNVFCPPIIFCPS